jgi:hypothetical protein
MQLDDYNCVLCNTGCEETPLASFLLMSIQSRLLELTTHSLELESGPIRYGH